MRDLTGTLPPDTPIEPGEGRRGTQNAAETGKGARLGCGSGSVNVEQDQVRALVGERNGVFGFRGSGSRHRPG